EKKEGSLKEDKNLIIQDLPGIYSLSPYTLEEVVSRTYLVTEQPDAILNIVDASNIERNLYLTTQLVELGIPVVVALNMMDVVRKNGDEIDTAALAKALCCEVVETAAVKSEGVVEAAKLAASKARAGQPTEMPTIFDGPVEHAIAHIEESIQDVVPSRYLRWYAIKLFERDERVLGELKLDASLLAHLEEHIVACEQAMDDEAQSIIADQRYTYIAKVVKKAVKKQRNPAGTTSDRIDRFVTHRVFALPIFALVMYMVYYISITTVGGWATDFTNDVIVGEWFQGSVAAMMEGAAVAPWLTGLVVDGIIGGVGAVIGFVPQMVVLFFLLAILEDIGYMSRVAFIMDRLFRRFGLSGKSFIPMLIGSGCSVPGIMASRTIENESDRRMTILTTSFIPCGAKMPIVGLIAGALFGGAGWVATVAYFSGIAAVIVSGLILKKTKAFAGEPSPCVMELPPYHVPSHVNVLRSTWERGWSFIKRAGTVILLASIIIWFTSSFGFVDGVFTMVEDMDHSILAAIGGVIAPLFAPLGFGFWEAAVATVMGLVAKEEVVGVFGVLFGVTGDAMALVEEGAYAGLAPIAAHFTGISAFSFLLFNLFCAPCFAAMGAIKREMNNWKWTLFAIGYETGFAYAVSFVFFQLALFLTGGGFTVLTGLAVAILAGMVWLMVRKNPYENIKAVSAVRAEAKVNA
ncbi:MAG: ferrous iron transport protein B, partial [Clostridia bacterium]|nr:ferrous iron transport protein B [Clostridia bacterium]